MSDLAHDVAPSWPAAAGETRLLGGRLLRGCAAHDRAVRYRLFVPDRCREDRPLLVAVHGISRNAGQHLRGFARWAGAYGVAVLAPRFGRRRFPDYQRLGRAGRGERADLALLRLIDETSARLGRGKQKVCLFGFSGGAQFAHRFALAHPERVARLAIAAAGWYTFPDPSLPYPRGLGGQDRPAGVELSLSEFLQIPTCVLVGELDTRRDRELRATRRLDREQGRDRVERARRWAAALAESAARHRIASAVSFELLRDSDHSFARADRRADLARRVTEFFFERRAAPARTAPDGAV